MPVVNKINISHFHHNINLVTLSQILIEKYSGIYFTEREIRNNQVFDNSKNKHISDRILQFDDKKIAIEYELSPKSYIRRKSIIDFYLKNLHFDEVWYIVKDQTIAKSLQQFLPKMHFLKVILKDDIMPV